MALGRRTDRGARLGRVRPVRSEPETIREHEPESTRGFLAAVVVHECAGPEGQTIDIDRRAVGMQLSGVDPGGDEHHEVGRGRSGGTPATATTAASPTIATTKRGACRIARGCSHHALGESMHAMTSLYGSDDLAEEGRRGQGSDDTTSRCRRGGAAAPADLPGGQRAVGAFNDLRTRVDELSKKVRGIDALEARVAKLEKELAALKRPASSRSPRKPS